MGLPHVSGWSVSEPLSSPPSLRHIQPYPRTEGLPFPSQVWLWGCWPAGGPGVQTRKPLRASWAKDSESIFVICQMEMKRSQGFLLRALSRARRRENAWDSGGEGAVWVVCRTWEPAQGHAAGCLPASSRVSLGESLGATVLSASPDRGEAEMG